MGKMINCTIIRSKRKTLAIHITKNAFVEVRAPLKLSQREIEKFVVQKQVWIEKTCQKILLQNENKIVLTKEREHELAHIREHNHSKRFWTIVESVLPNYREQRKKLKIISQNTV